MRPRVTLFPLLLAVFSCASRDEERAPDPPSYRLTVMTYNLFVGNVDAAGTLAAIRAGDADIVGLQEVTPRSAAFLDRALEGEYPHRLFHHAKRSSVGILSRYPVSEIAKIESPAGWFPGLAVRVALPTETIQVLVTHLKPVFLTDDVQISLLALPGSFRTHAAEIRHAWSKLDPTLPTIALGDFNEGERGPAVRWLTDEQGLRHAVTPFDTTPTWGVGQGIWRIATRLDHILHSRHFVSRNARVIQAGVSDHFPVVATLERSPDHGR